MSNQNLVSYVSSVFYTILNALTPYRFEFSYVSYQNLPFICHGTQGDRLTQNNLQGIISSSLSGILSHPYSNVEYTIRSDEPNQVDMRDSDDLTKLLAAITVCEWYRDSYDGKSHVGPQRQTLDMAIQIMNSLYARNQPSHRLFDYQSAYWFAKGKGSTDLRNWVHHKILENEPKTTKIKRTRKKEDEFPF